ncbi:MAG: T9SS type A sorting domain-containing protein [Bacteroidales bacterium]|nr:T9SS type A sorting domain-containing protein [Bacteroidales bacterium]
MKINPIVIVWLLIVLGSIGNVNAQPNLLGDPGFDDQSNIPGEFPVSGFWDYYEYGYAGAVVDGNHSFTPPYSLHVYTGSEVNSSYLMRVYQDYPTDQCKRFHAGAKLATPDGFPWQEGETYARIEVQFLDFDYDLIEMYTSEEYLVANSNWGLFDVYTPISPHNTHYARFMIRLERTHWTSDQSVVNVDSCFMYQLYPESDSLIIKPEIINFGASADTIKFKIYNDGSSVSHWSIEMPEEDEWLISATPNDSSTICSEFTHVTLISDRNALQAGKEYSSSISIIPDYGSVIEVPVNIEKPVDVPGQPSVVSLNNRQLMVQKRFPDNYLDEPRAYKIKGFAWSPAGIATNSSPESRREAFHQYNKNDLALIKGCNGNTVYTFLDFGLEEEKYSSVLDNLYEEGIMAIITVDEDGFYNLQNLEDVVNSYKNHPAVLMWAIGNEWNINLYHEYFDDLQEAAEATEFAAQLIKEIDTLHPVASIYGEINILNQDPTTYEIVNTICPSVDVWGLNIYRGDNFGELFEEWAQITDKPMFLSEFGVDAYHTIENFPIVGYVNEEIQKQWNHSLWLDLNEEISQLDPAKNCLGGTFFEWNDEWWKIPPSGQQNNGGFATDWNPYAFPDGFANEEYFGIVQIDWDARIPRATYGQIKQDFSIQNHVIQSTFDTGGYIYPYGTLLVENGTDQTFRIVPDENWIIDTLYIDGVEVEDANLYMFENIESDHTIHVSFEYNPGQQTQSISLLPSYQFVSSHIIPNEPDMEDVLSDIMDGELKFVRNSNGNMLQKIGPNWVNAIGDWQTEEGYLFNMYVSASITVEGMQIDPQTPISLFSGYQFVGYLPDAIMVATDAFATIMNDNLDFVRDSEGAMLRKIGPHWINNIGDVYPGEGYLIKMYAQDELIYPANISKSHIQPMKRPAYFDIVPGDPSCPVYTIYIQPSEGMAPGDEIAAYSNGNLVGSAVIESEDLFDNDIPVFSKIDNSKGYKPGSKIVLYHWSNDENMLTELSYGFINDYAGSWNKEIYPGEDGEFSIIKADKGFNRPIEEIFRLELFPNPVNSTFTISTNHIIEKVTIYTLSGQQLIRVFPHSKDIEMDLQQLDAGIYIIRLITKAHSETTKIVVQ